MKCKNCGYLLQIDYKVCPSCGTPNPFYKEHREEMERYSKEFSETQKEVLESTRKTTGAWVKFAISMVLGAAAIIAFLFSKKYDLGESIKEAKVKADVEQYRAEYAELEESRDYILLKHWFENNHLNNVSDFGDCLNVYNVCMFYEYVDSYLMEITYPEYMENAVRDKENYCESIIESYDCMQNYAESQRQIDDSDNGHMECIDSCIEQTKVLIMATFKLTKEQMESFDSITKNDRIGMLMENWPYDE
ncbi:MAG: zinc ribbon domain-containing protein [Lachnospiraceae bacterium]|nr:zinc ribbon domain-containing protein [Candidatus Colinaster equi]